MSAFLGQLLLRALSPAELAEKGSTGTQLYELLADFSYQSDKIGATITAPKGMITDFASIPRVLYSIIDPEDPRILFGSVIHDIIYKRQGELPGLTLTREEADAMLREGMEVCGSPSFLRNSVYQALRVGGDDAWRHPTTYGGAT